MDETSNKVCQRDDDSAKKKKKYEWRFVWSNIIFLSLLHVLAVRGFYLRQSMPFNNIFFGKFWGIMTGLGVTAGAHRLWCHRTYRANRAYQILVALMVSGTYQNSIYTWCRDHRVHHEYSETDADPHNSKRGFFFSHVGWLLVRKHPDVSEYGKKIDLSDLEANPIVMFQHRYYHCIVFVMAFVITTFVPYFLWGETLENGFFVITVYRYVVSLHVTWSINSLAHMFGSRPYDKNIGPAENPLTMYCSLGEGFHNYHHTFPWDYKSSELGEDVRNLTTEFINFFAWLGWVTDRRIAPRSTIIARSLKYGDGSFKKPSSTKTTIDLLSGTLVRCKQFFFFGLYLYLI